MFQHLLHLQLKLNSFLIFLSWYLIELKYTNIPEQWLMHNKHSRRCSYFFLIINPFVFLSFSCSANSSIFIICSCSLNKLILSPVTQLFIWLWMFPPCLPSRPDIIKDKLLFQEDFHLVEEKVKAYTFKMLFQKFTLYTPIINCFRIAILLELCTLFSTGNYCKN